MNVVSVFIKNMDIKWQKNQGKVVTNSRIVGGKYGRRIGFCNNAFLEYREVY